MWVLIVVIFGYSAQTGTAITSVDGFSTEAACSNAGQKLIEQESITFTHEPSRKNYLRYTCSFKGNKPPITGG